MNQFNLASTKERFITYYIMSEWQIFIKQGANGNKNHYCMIYG